MTSARVSLVVAVIGLLGLILAGCGGGSPSTVSPPSPPATPPPAATATLADVVQKVRSGVVEIEVTACDSGGIDEVLGTGFLVDRQFVATVEHVIDGAGRIIIKRNGEVIAQASIVGSDPARDLALLRLSVPVKGYVFRLKESAPRLGDEVAALGFPFGLPLTLTRGTVSGSDRTIPIGGINRKRLVQTDAAVNPGNSGGPLLRVDSGDVVGLVDLGGNGNTHGIAFAVSSIVAGPLLRAWESSPQPIPLTPCPTLPPVPVSAPPASPQPAPAPPDRGVGVPSTYQGRFTSVDRLERCIATAADVYCSAGPSGRAVKLTIGVDVEDLGVRGSQDLGGPSMPEGTAFTTPNGKLGCDSSSRGITCRDRTNGAAFVIGDYKIIVTHPNSHARVGTPPRYQGFFTSVDRLERCYASTSYVACTAGPSGKGVRLVVGGDATYEGVTGSTDKGGPSMPEGTSFTTPNGSIRCESSSRGITCRDLASGNNFTIGDYRVYVVNGGVETAH